MDKFLEIVYMNYADGEKDGERHVSDKYVEVLEPFTNRLKDLVSEKLYNELEELLSDCMSENNHYYATKGMELAIGVMNGTYIPKL